MKRMKGVVITGTNTLAVSEDCPLPEKICPTGALIRPLIWSPCTRDADPSADLVALHQRRSSVRHRLCVSALPAGQGGGA